MENGYCLMLPGGQGYYNDELKISVRRFTPIYFDMDPKYFYAKHFPDSAMYEGNTGNKEGFLNSPLIYDEFIKENCEVLMPFSGIIKANDGDKITFKIKNISRIDDLYYLNKKKERVMIENPKEQNGVLEFQVTYNRKMGRFITFFLFRESLVAFKITPK
jgi:hypothetical protein